MACTAMTPEMLAAELDNIPPPTLAKLKRKLGMAGRDLESMTPEEQTQLLQLFRRGTTKPRDTLGPIIVPPAQQQHLPGQRHGLYTPPPYAGQPRPSTHPPIPMQHVMTRAGLWQPGQGTANPRIHQPQNIPQHAMAFRAPPPRRSNHPPLPSPLATNLDRIWTDFRTRLAAQIANLTSETIAFDPTFFDEWYNPRCDDANGP